EFDWVVFTSANGVRVFFDRLQRVGADVRQWHRARFAAIGPQTARTLEHYCVRVDALPDEYRAEAVAAALGRLGIRGQRVLLPRAAAAREVLPVQLRELGATVEEVATYSTIRAAAAMQEGLDLLQRGAVDLITFTSSSTVQHFVEAVDGRLDQILATAA